MQCCWAKSAVPHVTKSPGSLGKAELHSTHGGDMALMLGLEGVCVFGDLGGGRQPGLKMSLPLMVAFVGGWAVGASSRHGTEQASVMQKPIAKSFFPVSLAGHAFPHTA